MDTSSLDDALLTAARFCTLLKPEIAEPLSGELIKALRWMHGETMRPVSLRMHAAGHEWEVFLSGRVVAIGPDPLAGDDEPVDVYAAKPDIVELEADNECVRCGRFLAAGSPAYWFEFRIGDFSPVLPGETVPAPGDSQGCFPMGVGCARRVLAKGWDK